MALESSPDQPLALRVVSNAISGWIGRLGVVWVEAQVAELTRRPGMGTVFLVLRDPAVDLSLRATCRPSTCDAMAPALEAGMRVVVRAKPDFYAPRGELRLAVDEIRHVGVGELLARLDHLRRVLQAEGLFDPARRKPLPFLPRCVGLVTGRNSAAERDVVTNARARWPAVRFKVEAVAVQGPAAVAQVGDAIRRLDRDRDVDVIVVARGGGSLEDLLPFSDEQLVRTAAACATPLVSAIGHEPDSPLLDFVADLRASTPTDAGKRVVPDMAEELARLRELRGRVGRAAAAGVERESQRLAALRSRPCLADPAGIVGVRAEQVAAARQRALRRLEHLLEAARDDLAHQRARVAALSPRATLERGYAVVQDAAGAIVREPGSVADGQPLSIRLAQGTLAATAGVPA